MATNATKDQKPGLLGPTAKLSRKPRKTVKKKTPATRKPARRGAAKKRK
jgi:hypothetical protein